MSEYADPTETHYDGDDEDDEPDEWEMALQECGQAPGMGCQLAGTEFCDFECPYHDIDLNADDEEES